MTRSVSFDRAAGYYDATRRLPDAVMGHVVELLGTELAGHQPTLEIGVGTGRIALPLSAHGIAVLGCDLSAAMLGRLLEKTGPGGEMPVLRADATALPLAGSSVGSVLACHVLHLVEGWREAADEALRVLRPGGRFLVDFGGGAPAPWSEATEEVLADHGVVRVRPGVSRSGDLAAYLSRRAVARPLPAVYLTETRSLGVELEALEEQIYAWSWDYEAALMKAACTGVRAWAAGGGWRLDEEVEVRSTIQYWAFDTTL
ncbi:MAG: class I SAM-dependent methyltransferase [Acidimicrobiales bacterium]